MTHQAAFTDSRFETLSLWCYHKIADYYCYYMQIANGSFLFGMRFNAYKSIVYGVTGNGIKRLCHVNEGKGFNFVSLVGYSEQQDYIKLY